MTKYGTKETKPMFKHLSECEMFNDYCWLYSLSSLFSEDQHGHIFLTSHIFNAVLIGSNKRDAFGRSLTYTRNRGGPRIDILGGRHK